MSVSAVSANASERFGFTLFLAAALHIILVLGITFQPHEPRLTSNTIEVTLSQFDDKEAPKDADFLAATNQIGSGDQEQKSELTSPEIPTLADEKVKAVQPPNVESLRPEPQKAEQKKVITTQQLAREKRQFSDFDLEADTAQPDKRISMLERSLEIASLEARLDEQQRAYAKRPRVLRVTAASTLQTADAYYVQSWVDKVTRIGNLNYPDEARREGLYGNLRVLVGIYPDGSLKEIRVLESSGHRVLDDAAVRTVRLAAPYAPFPDSLRKTRDVLEIIRTWSFQRRGLSSF